jgi:hypothetical protein
MAKYALFISISLLIASIILFSSFIKDNPSYTGIARAVSKVNNNKAAHIKKEHVNDYGKSNVPEIDPITIINQDIPKTSSSEEDETKKSLKKEALKKEKKKLELITPEKEEIILVKADTFVIQTLASSDTLSPKIANEQIQEQPQGKKKKKKFLFFKIK